MGQTWFMFWPAQIHRLAAIMLPAPPSALRRASTHEGVRRELMAQLDERWHSLWGSFGMSVILMGFGAQLAWHRWDEQWMASVSLLVAGSLLWLVHRQRVQHWHTELHVHDDWLSALDQMVVATGMVAAIMVPAGEWWWPVPLLAGCTWGAFKLVQNAQAHWAHWHFVVARRVLGERRRVMAASSLIR